MRVLVACEESQVVCAAFRELGHEAYSCDIVECSGGYPEWHIQCDVLNVLNPKIFMFPCGIIKGVFFKTMDGKYHFIDGKWDLIIAHPPCTYLSNAGARWLWSGSKLNESRFIKGLAAKHFFFCFLNADCDRIAVENPTPSKVFQLPNPSQIIQPFQFGDPWSKRTCLWLKGLDPLKPTNLLNDYKPFCTSGSYSRTHDEKYKGSSRSGGSSKSRSKTFSGIAAAMAAQWGIIT